MKNERKILLFDALVDVLCEHLLEEDWETIFKEHVGFTDEEIREYDLQNLPEMVEGLNLKDFGLTKAPETNDKKAWDELEEKVKKYLENEYGCSVNWLELEILNDEKIDVYNIKWNNDRESLDSFGK